MTTWERLKKTFRKIGAWLILDGLNFAMKWFLIIACLWCVGGVLFILFTTPIEVLKAIVFWVAVMAAVGLFMLGARLFNWMCDRLYIWAHGVREEEKK